MAENTHNWLASMVSPCHSSCHTHAWRWAFSMVLRSATSWMNLSWGKEEIKITYYILRWTTKCPGITSQFSTASPSSETQLYRVCRRTWCFGRLLSVGPFPRNLRRTPPTSPHSAGPVQCYWRCKPSDPPSLDLRRGFHPTNRTTLVGTEN